MVTFAFFGFVLFVGLSAHRCRAILGIPVTLTEKVNCLDFRGRLRFFGSMAAIDSFRWNLETF